MLRGTPGRATRACPSARPRRTGPTRQTRGGYAQGVPGSPDEEALRRLREGSGVSLDEEGRFLHRGEPITHARTLEVLRRSFRREPDGRYTVSIGREVAHVAITAAPYAVRGLAPTAGGGSPRLLLSDGSEEQLDPTTLVLGRDGILRCTVKGDHLARFTRAGQQALGSLLEEDPPGSGSYALVVNGRRWRIRGPG
jgi:uncharacterized protein